MTEFDDQIIRLLTVTRNFMGFPRSYSSSGPIAIQTVIRPDENLNLGHDGVFYALALTIDDNTRAVEQFVGLLNNSGHVDNGLTLYDRTIPFDKLIERCFQPSPYIVGVGKVVDIVGLPLIEKMSRLELATIMQYVTHPDSLIATLWLHHISTLWVMVREYLLGQSVSDTITNIEEAVQEIIQHTVDGLNLDGVSKMYAGRTGNVNTSSCVRVADPLSAIMNIIQLKMVDMSRRTIVDFLHEHYRKGFEDHVRAKFDSDPQKRRQMLILASTWLIRDPAEYLSALLTIEKIANEQNGGLDDVAGGG